MTEERSTTRSDEILADLRHDGWLDSEGAFTVDVAQAREKLGAFRLASPAHWVLPLIAFAAASDAAACEFECHGVEWRVRHYGRTLGRDELASAMVELGSNDTRLNHLAAALQAFKSLSFRVEVSSGPWVLCCDAGRETLTESAEAVAGVHIRITLNSKLGRVVGGLRGSADAAHREVLVRACTWSPMTVRLNGTVLNRLELGPGVITRRSARQFPDAVDAPHLEAVKGDGESARVASRGPFDAEFFIAAGSGRLILVVDGLTLVVNDRHFVESGVSAVVWTSAVGLDISYGAMVQDGAWFALMGLLWEHADALICDLAEFINRKHAEGGHPLREFGAAEPTVRLALESIMDPWSDVSPRNSRSHRRDESTPRRAATASALLILYASLEPRSPREDAALSRLLSVAGPTAPMAALDRLDASIGRAVNGGAMDLIEVSKQLRSSLRGGPAGLPQLRFYLREVRRGAEDSGVGGLVAAHALDCARYARDMADQLDVAPAIRALAYDVEGLTLRWSRQTAGAETLHRMSSRLLGESASPGDVGRPDRARAARLLAETLLARGDVERAVNAYEIASAILTGDGVDTDASSSDDAVDILIERARLAWLCGHVASAYDLCLHAVRLADKNGSARTIEAGTWTQGDGHARLAARVALLEALRSLVTARRSIWSQIVERIRHPAPPYPVSVEAHGARRQLQWLFDFVRADRAAPDLLIRKLTTEMLAFEHLHGASSTMWHVSASHLVFALRLAAQWEEADSLCARVHLIHGLRYTLHVGLW